jgi:glycosyltransferase involved in cell wall biosynthesis
MSPVDLTIVMELDTSEITGRCDAAAHIRDWIAQLEAAQPLTSELLLCSPFELDAPEPASVPVRVLFLPGVGYYGLKNAGANAARGSIVIFTDADCRPSPGYVKTLLEVFADPETSSVAGCTFYDRDGVMPRLNTCFSFGLTHGEQEVRAPFGPLTHNVALRRSAYDRDPFGPFTGRVGGDEYLGRVMRERGCPIPLHQRLVIFHEDVSYSIRGMLERHLRESFVVLSRERRKARSPAWCVIRATLGTALWKSRLIWRYGSAVGLRPLDFALAPLVIALYAVVDLASVLTVLGVPAAKRRWYAYLFGQPLASRLLVKV